MKKVTKSILSLVLAFMVAFASLGVNVAMADTNTATTVIYVGKVAFDADKITSDAAYKKGFQDYLAAHGNDTIIVSSNGLVFDANKYSNAPTGQDPIVFATATVPADAMPVWDGKGPAGVVTPAGFTVADVDTSNLKNVKITFSAAVNPDTIEAMGSSKNVKIYVNGATTSTTALDEALSADNKTLIVSLGTLSQSDSLRVVVTGVKDENGTTLTDYDATKTVADVKVPSLSTVTVVNSKQIQLVFTEPVKVDTGSYYMTTDLTNTTNANSTGINIKVDGSLVYAKLTNSTVNNAVVVDFYNKLADGNHTITVSDARDFAGYKMEARETGFATVADTTAPVAKSVTYITKTKVKVTFDENINFSAATFAVYQTGDATNYYSTKEAVTGDSKSVYLNLIAPGLNASATLGFTVQYANVYDVFSNTVSTLQSITGKVVDDTTIPTVTAKVGAVTGLSVNTVALTFSKPVNLATGVSSNVKLYKADGVTLVEGTGTVYNASTSPDYMNYYVVFNGLNNVDAAQYQVYVSGVKDTSIRENQIAATMLPISAVDSKTPALMTAVVKQIDPANANYDRIELVFSEAMNTTLLGNIANYFVGNGNANTPANTIVGAAVYSISADGTKVTLSVPNARTFNKVAMPGLKDVAGNYVSGVSIAAPFTIDTSYAAFDKNKVAEVAMETKNSLTIYLNPGTIFTATAPADFMVTTNKTTVNDTTLVDLGITSAQLSADRTSVTLTFNRALNADGTYTGLAKDGVTALTKAPIYVYTNPTTVVTADQNGTKMAITAATAVSVTDYVAPTSTVAYVNSTSGLVDGKIVVTFSEDVVRTSLLIGADVNQALAQVIVLKDKNGARLVPNTDYTVDLTGNKLTVTVIKPGFYSVITGFELSADYLKDAAGNHIAAISSNSGSTSLVSTIDLDIQAKLQAIVNANITIAVNPGTHVITVSAKAGSTDTAIQAISATFATTTVIDPASIKAYLNGVQVPQSVVDAFTAGKTLTGTTISFDVASKYSELKAIANSVTLTINGVTYTINLN